MWRSPHTHAAAEDRKVLWHQQQDRSTIRPEGITGSIFSMLRRRYPYRSVEHRTDLHQIAGNERPLVINSCLNAMGRKVQAVCSVALSGFCHQMTLISLKIFW